MFSRSQNRAQGAIDRLRKENPSAQIEFIQFDLTSIASCRKAASEFMAQEEKLHILINNAGIMMTPYELSKDGIELQACNGVGHFALTTALLPVLKSTAAADPVNSHVRIVNVASDGQDFAAKVDFTSLKGLNAEACSSTERYGNSKLSVSRQACFCGSNNK
jgi:NAD(P)-dependent dehydrogenase (short-subunit alcohol dehydrogenase family)